jgi:RHS repeat-associated protein
MTQYTWDHRNRLTSVTEPSGKVVSYGYDAFNRLVSRTVDPDGNGPQPATTTHFIYDDNQIVLELSGSVASTPEHRYLWGAAVDQILADETVDDGGAEDVLWPLTDHLGTVRDLAAYDGQATSVANHRVYDAFGNLTSETAPAVDHLFGFTGRPFDEDTGLQNNLNRWYDPSVGRWLSEDPIGFVAEDANLARYVGNWATALSDPLGLAPPSDSAGKAPTGNWLNDWENPGNWQLGGSGTITTPTDYDKNLKDEQRNLKSREAFPCGFDMDLDFRFKGELHQPPGVTNKVSFVGNSGVYIYNAIEIQIIDTDTIVRKFGKNVIKNGKVALKGYAKEDVNTLITGIPYGVGTVTLADNPLKPWGAADLEASLSPWNHMRIRFEPIYAWAKDGKYADTSHLLGGKITVWVNNKQTYYGKVSKGTGSKAKIKLSDVKDRYVYLQSHWGSQVEFSRVVIRKQQYLWARWPGPNE